LQIYGSVGRLHVVPTELSRLLPLPAKSFFVFGPRGVGKSTWLRRVLPVDTPFIDLLRADLFLELSRDPGRLEARVGHRPARSWVCIDEIQKIPALLDEVHRLIETRRLRFALSGSSARRLRRAGVNLLGGRAVTRRLGPFVSAELGAQFSLSRALEWGLLPMVALEPRHAPDTLAAYVHTYIREEIREEGLVRRIDPFLRFLHIAGQVNGQQLSVETIARDAQVPRTTVDGYFTILIDTLLADLLPAYRPQAKVRERAHPKLYWFDPGVARAAANLLHDPLDSIWRGTALETLLLHELRVYNHVAGRERPIAYYRTAAGAEIDFVIEKQRRTTSKPARLVCIEVKSSPRWKREWNVSMLSLARSEQVAVERMIGVYAGRERLTVEGVEVFPVQEFLTALHAGEIF
jgi:predicted AAA+ superfamily ATPase